MTTPAHTVVRTITEAEIRKVTHYCHFIAALKGLRSAVMYRFAEYTPFELLTTLHAACVVDSRGACDYRRTLVPMRTNYR